MPDLASKLECTGCTACMVACPQKCISMVEQEDGFLYPEIDLEKCIKCQKCMRVCPVLSIRSSILHKTSAFAAYSTDNDLRKDSSSGGIFSEIAIEVINKGGVVFGAAYTQDFEIKHICIDNIEELYRLRGAKYAQSVMGKTYFEIKGHLEKNKLVLFVGTPCQVVGLKSFLSKDYPQLICIDFVCHGVPSPSVWKAYVKYRSDVDNNGIMPTSINLRSKETGWSHYKYSNVFNYQQKSWSCLNEDNIFMNLFIGDYINRLSCSHCKAKGYDRVSDITLGDFWGIWDVDPCMDDNKGTSVVLLHSKKGEELFSSIKNRIVYKAVNLSDASYMNKSLLNSAAEKSERMNYINKANKGEFADLEILLMHSRNEDVSLIQRIKSKICRLVNRL